MNFTKKKPLWLAVFGVIAVAVVVLSNLDGAVSFVERFLPGSDQPAIAAPVSATTPPPSTPPAVTSTPRPTTTTTTSGSPSTSTTRTDPPPTDGWYDLIEYQSASWNNGFDAVDTVGIGTARFPSSIVGYYGSSVSDPMNRATWAISGKCDRFTVSIGKDVESPSSAGVGRFIVKLDDQEAFAGEMSMPDPARVVDLDITGKSRLTILDTRRSQDAKNAWGRPRVHCSEPPGKKR
ncbi:NPCBM/NEW2 domain-containing protein [Nocardia jiangsuensis]|uniref:NPCBM/NEW2 domain-containing protein n=1 Tax=Nocardia jiangsuensis TaxID=1691563 RepID=A0ABV8DWQ4_9NOCA